MLRGIYSDKIGGIRYRKYTCRCSLSGRVLLIIQELLHLVGDIYQMTAELEKLIQTVQKLSSDEKDYLLNVLQQAQGKHAQAEKIADMRLRYPAEWIAVCIPAGEDKYAPERGYLIAHSADRSHVWAEVHAQSEKDIYVFFNGPISPKGFTVTFHDTEDLPDVAKVVSQ